MNIISSVFSHLNTHSQKVIDTIKTSFWFVPSTCILLSLVAVMLTQYVDHILVDKHWPILTFFYDIEPVSARSVLETIATSVITITSIAFSMVVVTLTLASTQFGPRLLRNFMRDKKTQLALAVFVSTFTFCLALIRFVSIDEKSPFVPGLGLSVALLLTMMSIFMLVFLIHNIAISIQAESVVDRCWRCLAGDIDRIYGDHSLSAREHDGPVTWGDQQQGKPITVQTDGFIQLIDIDGLIELLQETNSALSISVKPGDYVCAHSSIATLFDYSDEAQQPDTEQIVSYFVIGSIRTPLQDAAFAINQLVEIGLRALSPGINDPFTAILCINRLGSALVKISLENAPSEKLKDEQGQIRIERNVASFEELVKTACNQLRQASLTHPNVVTSILDMLNNVCCSINNDQHKAYLVQQGSCLMDMIKTQNVHALDMQDIATKHDRLMKHSNSKR